eukprot:augustus_masked-scaffold_39-processed-gene-1.8-mRNA-1 protein AED:0.28 eAED:0.28 QI:0/-1/0/1/-1/1/1/0/311
MSAPAPVHKNVSIHTLQDKKHKNIPITMVTAYDYPSAVHVDKAGIDVLLVGDSLGMVELGFDTTLPVSMDMMVHHCQAVVRGCRRPLLVADLPFGSFEASEAEAIRNSSILLKEGGMDAVKIEGGKKRAHLLSAVVDSGVAVMGHIGLTPQAVSGLGGFKAQGKTAEAAERLIEDALALEDAGVFGIVLECVPEIVGTELSKVATVPIIGIGSGKGTDGQVLVYHDLLGMMQHYHHAEFTPSFSKQYASVGYEIQNGLAKYKEEVENRIFPGEGFAPYKINKTETEKFVEVSKRYYRKTESKEQEDNIKVY